MSKVHSRRHSDDDDDRPRRRRTADDDRPRRGKESAKAEKPARKTGCRKRASPALILSVGAGVFILAVVGVIVVMLVSSRPKPASADLLAYAPSDAVIVSGYDFNDLLPAAPSESSEPYRRALARRPPTDLVELDRAGLGPATLARVLFARTPNTGNACVVRFRNAPERSRYLGADVLGRTYAPFISLTGNYKFGYFPDPSTLVLTDQEPTVQAIQDKGAKVHLPVDLKAMIDRTRGPVWRASGRISAADREKLGKGDDGFAIRAGASLGTAAWLERDGPMGTVHYELLFETVAEARAGSAALKGLILQRKGLTNDFGQFMGQGGIDPADFGDIRRGYEEAEVTESGTKVTGRLRLPASEALRVVGSVRY